MTIHIAAPANDNRPARSATRGRSTIAAYRKGTTYAAFLRITLEDARAHGLEEGDRVRAEAVPGGIRLVRDPKGAQLLLRGNRLFVRFGKLFAAQMPARSLTLNGHVRDVLATFDSGGYPGKRLPEHYLADFESLSGRKGATRRNLLATSSALPKAATKTSAGDECYSPIFISSVVLRALRLDRFDVDVCAMRSDGCYFNDIDLSTVIVTKGKFAKRFGSVDQIVGRIPARHYLTNDQPFGSLLFEWLGVVWLNPPYSERCWAAFLEKANREVANDNASIVVALVPADNADDHSRHVHGEHAFRIELSRQLPFFKRRKRVKDKYTRETVVLENVIEPIRNNQIVVFGKGRKTQEFILRLIDELEAIEYLTDAHARHYREVASCLPRLCAA